MSGVDLSHAEFLHALRENGFASLRWTERRERVRRIAGEIRASGRVCRDETVLALLLLLTDDGKSEVRQEVARLIPKLPYEIGLQIECRLDDDRDAYVCATVRAARKERLKNERDVAILSKGVEILACRTDAVRNLADTDRVTLFDRILDLLKRGAEAPDSAPRGVSLRDAANIHEDCDPERVEATLRRWNKSRIPKPAPIGKDSRHKQADLFRPADLADYVERNEGSLIVDKAFFIQRLQGMSSLVRLDSTDQAG